MRVLEVCCGLDLRQEPLRADHCSQVRLKDLQRDLSLVLEVIRQVHRGHPALTDFLLDEVPA